MTIVRVITATRLGLEIVRADVELDGVLVVRGVELTTSLVSGRPVASPPHRPWGDGRRVIDWSPVVAAEIAVAIMRSLEGGTVAVLDGETLR